MDGANKLGKKRRLQQVDGDTEARLLQHSSTSSTSNHGIGNTATHEEEDAGAASLAHTYSLSLGATMAGHVSVVVDNQLRQQHQQQQQQQQQPPAPDSNRENDLPTFQGDQRLINQGIEEHALQNGNSEISTNQIQHDDARQQIDPATSLAVATSAASQQSREPYIHQGLAQNMNDTGHVPPAASSPALPAIKNQQQQPPPPVVQNPAAASDHNTLLATFQASQAVPSIGASLPVSLGSALSFLPLHLVYPGLQAAHQVHAAPPADTAANSNILHSNLTNSFVALADQPAPVGATAATTVPSSYQHFQTTNGNYDYGQQNILQQQSSYISMMTPSTGATTGGPLTGHIQVLVPQQNAAPAALARVLSQVPLVPGTAVNGFSIAPATGTDTRTPPMAMYSYPLGTQLSPPLFLFQMAGQQQAAAHGLVPPTWCMAAPTSSAIYPSQGEQPSNNIGATATESAAPSNASTASVPKNGTVKSLYMPCDDDVLCTTQILLRQQLEFFEAQAIDIETLVSGRRRPIVMYQVGVRCRHCAHIHPTARKKGNAYYPSRLVSIYQAAQNICSSHLCDSCQHLDPWTRTKLLEYQITKTRKGYGGKNYWAQAGQALGIIETQCGLRFMDTSKQEGGEHQGEQEGTQKRGEEQQQY